MTHHCHAIACETPCKPEFLMCPPHWRCVPSVLQRQVYATYRPGQCDDKRPSPAWFVAAERAIVAVAVIEKKLTPAEAQARVERTIASFGVKTRVVNKDKGERFDVYIGRGSIFGNPFSHLPSQHPVIVVPNKSEAIRRYREWVLGRDREPRQVPPTKLQIQALRGRVLGCTCAPDDCHGDVLAELAEDWDAAAAPRPPVEVDVPARLSTERINQLLEQGARGAAELDQQVKRVFQMPPDAGQPRSWNRKLRERLDETDDPGTFLRWVGSKRWAAAMLAERVMKHLAPGGRYFEPFLGAGSVALALPTGTPMVLSDFCAPLMGLWWWLKKSPQAIIDTLGPHLDWSNTEENYYRLRECYNQQKFSTMSAIPAATFLYLNAAGFNGVYRENQDGGYNVPWGKRKTIRLPSRDELLAVSEHLKTAQVLLGCDFEEPLRGVRAGDVVFADPPYDDVFADYNAGGFGPREQERLAAALRTCVNRGATVLMTNADTPRIRDLYAGFTIEPLEEPRRVAARASSRTNTMCVLVTGN